MFFGKSRYRPECEFPSASALKDCAHMRLGVRHIAYHSCSGVSGVSVASARNDSGRPGFRCAGKRACSVTTAGGAGRKASARGLAATHWRKAPSESIVALPCSSLRQPSAVQHAHAQLSIVPGAPKGKARTACRRAMSSRVCTGFRRSASTSSRDWPNAQGTFHPASPVTACSVVAGSSSPSASKGARLRSPLQPGCPGGG